MCKATVQSHKFWCHSWWLVFVFLFVTLFLVLFFFISLEFWGWGEALIIKILGFLGGAGHYNSAGQSNWEVFWFGWGCRDSKFQLSSVGKLNGWVLELNFAGQMINFKSLFWILYSFTEFIYFSIYSSAFIYLFIDIFYICMSFVDFLNCE